MPKYIILKTKAFSKSVERLIRSGRFDRSKLELLITLLAYGKKLDQKYSDHALTGEWKGHRECHLGFDLLLIYTIDENILILTLVNIGSHSYLFGR